MSDFIEVTDKSYKEFIAGHEGLLLFYKEVCPHCKAIKKVFERYKSQNPSVILAQIDSEENPQIMESLNIERVPTMLIIKDGQEAFRKVGLFNVKELTSMVNQL